MPVTIRAVSPVDVSLNRMDSHIQRDELLCVANGTLANLIRQLSSLNRNAEQLFSEIHREVLKINHTTNTLFLRLNRLSHKIQQPSSTLSDLVSLENNHMRKAFRSTTIIDQHSLDRQTIPTKLSELYTRCEPPPDLNQLSAYRDDSSREALSLYTDPGYFFDLWKQEMLKDIGRVSRSATSGASSGNHLSKSPMRCRRQREQQEIYSAPIIMPYQQCGQLQNSRMQPPIYRSNVLLHHNKITDAEDQLHRTHQNIYMSHSAMHRKDQQQLQFPSEYETPQNLLKMSAEKSYVTSDSQAVDEKDTFVRNQDAFFSYQHNQQGQVQQFDKDFRVPQNDTKQNIAIESCYQHISPAVLKSSVPDGNMPNFHGFLEEDEDELPPPPPALSSNMSMIVANNESKNEAIITNTHEDNQKLVNTSDINPVNVAKEIAQHSIQLVPVTATGEKSGNVASGQIKNIPPPPPPPPPLDSYRSANIISRSFAQNADDNKESVVNATTVSNLMLDIQRGKQLKKVQMETELNQKRSSEDNDVAAILRRRMEQVLGTEDDEDDDVNNDDDGEWDD